MKEGNTKGKSGDIFLKQELYRLIQSDETVFDFILESSYDGLWYHDLTTDKVIFSRGWTEVLGDEALDLKNGTDTFSEFIYEQDLDLVNENLAQYLSGKIQQYKIKFRMKLKNGSLLWVLVKGVASWDKKGRASLMVGTISDVSEKKHTTTGYKPSEKKTRARKNSVTHDNITDRKQDDMDIHLAQETYLGIINSVTESIYIQDEDGVFLDVNQAALDYYGLKKQDIVGKTPSILSAEGKNDLKQLPFTIKKAFRGEPQRFEFWGKKADGTIFPTDVTLTSGNYFGKKVVIAVARDISDRKQTEERNRQSQQLLQSISDNMFDLVALTDLEGNYTFTGASHKILGYNTNELVGTNVMEYVHPDDLPMVKSAFEEFVKKRQNNKKIQYRNRCADGSYLWFETVGRFIYDEGGNLRQILFNSRDITDRRKADEALRESEERFRMLAELAPVGIIITDENQNPSYVSPTFTHIFGYTIKDIRTVNHWFSLAYPDENFRNKLKQEWLEFTEKVNSEGGADKPLEYPVHCSNGSVKQIEFRLAISGGVHVIIFIDVTESKKAREEIARERMQLLSIFNSIDEVIYISDTETHEILYVNKNCTDRLKKNCVGKICYKEFHNLDAPCSFCTNSIIKSNNEQPYYWEFHNHFIEKDFAITDRLIDWPDGRKVRFEIAIDITQQKIAEQALRESEERFRSLFENASIGIYRTTPDGKILMANPALIKMLGFSSFNELEKRNLSHEGFETNTSRNAFQQQIEEKGEVRAMESLWTTKNGSTIFVSESARAFRDKKGNILYYQGTVEDITYRKKAEEVSKELEIANKTAQFKQNFLANMSHEIRTPLTGVLGMIEIMEHTTLTHDQRDYLDTIKKSGENLREVINQVLDYSKIEAGKVTLNSSIFEFKSLPANTLLLFKNNVSTGVKLQSTIDPEIPAWIEADSVRLSQVLNNLVSNAVKFTSQGTISIRSSLAFSNPENGQIVIKVEVSDTGPGIPEDLQKKLFIPFSQIEAMDIRNHDGTGLGLSICKQLLQMMNGEIGLISSEGKGSTFWFTFPALIAQKPQLSVLKKDSAVTEKKHRILLAEDKVVNQKVIKLMLSSMGHSLTIANNGQEAIELFQPGHFDLILMDIQMPVMDGVTATQKLKETYDNLPPIIGLSANAFEGDREKYMALGMDEYLTKPVKKGDFEGLIEKLFSQPQNPQSG